MLRPFLVVLSVAVLFFAQAQQPRPATAATLVVEIGLYGREQVPPVDTEAYGFVRFFFNEDRTGADYTVDVKNISTAVTTGADIHRGTRGHEGPVVFHLTDGGFIVTGGHLRLSRRDVDEMLAGDWYITLSTVQHPDGELRGQIVLPANFLPATPVPPPPAPPATSHEPAAPTPSESQQGGDAASGQQIRPPNTGDAGLR